MGKFSSFSKKKIFIVLCTLSIFVSFSSLIPVSVKSEDLKDELDRIEQEIAAIRAEREKIQGQINNHQYTIEGYNEQISQIHGEVLVFQSEIDTLQLEIRQLEINIELLEDKIEENKKEITQITDSVGSLEKESKARIKDSYIKFRLTSGGSVSETNILSTENINQFFKDSQYITIIQEDTNDMLIELATLKDELEEKKQELDEKLKNISKEKEAIEIKRSDLEKRRDEIDQKKLAYYAQINQVQREIQNAQGAVAVFSHEEAAKQAEAERIRQAIFNSYTPVSSGEWVASGRPIGNQGCTGLCTGPHLHFMVAIDNQWVDPCGYLKPGGPVGGCGWGDRLDWPIGGTVYYTSGFGNRCFMWGGQNYCDFHAAIDLAGQPWNTVIFSAHDGYAFKGVDSYGANYVIICETQNCSSGLKTGYWHLSNF